MLFKSLVARNFSSYKNKTSPIGLIYIRNKSLIVYLSMMALQISRCISIFKTNISFDSPAKSVSNHVGPPNVAYFIQRYYYLRAVQHAVFF